MAIAASVAPGLIVVSERLGVRSLLLLAVLLPLHTSANTAAAAVQAPELNGTSWRRASADGSSLGISSVARLSAEVLSKQGLRPRGLNYSLRAVTLTDGELINRDTMMQAVPKAAPARFQALWSGAKLAAVTQRELLAVVALPRRAHWKHRLRAWLPWQLPLPSWSGDQLEKMQMVFSHSASVNFPPLNKQSGSDWWVLALWADRYGAAVEPGVTELERLPYTSGQLERYLAAESTRSRWADLLGLIEPQYLAARGERAFRTLGGWLVGTSKPLQSAASHRREYLSYTALETTTAAAVLSQYWPGDTLKYWGQGGRVLTAEQAEHADWPRLYRSARWLYQRRSQGEISAELGRHSPSVCLHQAQSLWQYGIENTALHRSTAPLHQVQATANDNAWAQGIDDDSQAVTALWQRQTLLMQQGQAQVDVLVYYPWQSLPGDWSAESRAAKQWLQSQRPVLAAMSAQGLSWLWLNDDRLAELQADAIGLSLDGRGVTSVLLLPSFTSGPSIPTPTPTSTPTSLLPPPETVTKINRLSDAGAQIWLVENPGEATEPVFQNLPKLASSDIGHWARSTSANNYFFRLSRSYPGLLSHYRDAPIGRFRYLKNSSEVPLELRFSSEAQQVQQLNVRTAEIRLLQAVRGEYRLSLAAGEAAWLWMPIVAPESIELSPTALQDPFEAALTVTEHLTFSAAEGHWQASLAVEDDSDLSVDRYQLNLADDQASYRLLVNGAACASSVFSPHQFELSRCLNTGPNILSLSRLAYPVSAESHPASPSSAASSSVTSAGALSVELRRD